MREITKRSTIIEGSVWRERETERKDEKGEIEIYI